MRLTAVVIMIIAVASPLYAAVFPGYDFTFFRTITDSLMVNTDKQFGIDYTGYGFVGSDMNTGIYMRIGLQAPFSSLSALFDDEKDESNSIQPESLQSPDDIQTMLETSFSASLSLGPAFRSLIGEDVIWYMGLGFSASVDYDNIRQRDGEVSMNVALSFGTDLDTGFRIDLTDRTTLRIGIHVLTLLAEVNIDSTRLTLPDGSSTDITDAYLIPDLFLPLNQRKGMEAEGYISLGHTFRQPERTERYRYSVASGSVEPTD